MDENSIYLDHGAATPLDERVLEAMKPYFSQKFFNPSSPYLPAVLVRREYEEAKSVLANLIGAKSGEIIITAGATESINLVFNSISGHVIVPNIEHQAILANAFCKDSTIVGSNPKGLISPESIKSTIKPNTQLVSVALANNEIGTIQPIREIAEVIKSERQNRLMRGEKMPIYLHTDASQASGLLDINVARLGVDMMTLNAGKIYGPKQVGLLWSASHVKLQPLVIGGGQERGLRSGTENVAGTIGFAKALEIVIQHRNFETKRLKDLRDMMQNELINNFPDAVVSGHQKHRLANYLHVAFPRIDGERLVFILENRGVLVATGSACSANKATRSYVLDAIELSDEIANGSIRITLGRLSTQDNIKTATEIIIEEVKNEYKRLNT